jgi:hypothetical protein
MDSKQLKQKYEDTLTYCAEQEIRHADSVFDDDALWKPLCRYLLLHTPYEKIFASEHHEELMGIVLNMLKSSDDPGYYDPLDALREVCFSLFFDEIQLDMNDAWSELQEGLHNDYQECRQDDARMRARDMQAAQL